jgi:hypothetical protein
MKRNNWIENNGWNLPLNVEYTNDDTYGCNFWVEEIMTE